MGDSNDHSVNNTLRLVQRLPIMLLSKAFVVLVCVCLLTVDAFQTWNAYEVRLAEGSVHAGNLARSVAHNADDTIKQADTILVGLVERLEREGRGRAQLDRLRNLLIMHVGELPKLHGLFVYDETGRWLVTNRNMVLNANNSDREYFIYHRTHPDRAAYISKPVHSRSTGEWIVPVSRRLNYPDGSFAGVVLATLHMKYFRSYYDTFNIGQDGMILLARRGENGAVLVHRPFYDEKIGSSLKDSALFRFHLPNASTGTYMLDEGYIDDKNRMVSYQKVENYPLVAAVTLSKDEVFRRWWIDAAKHFAITLALTAVLAFLGMRLTNQIAFRLRAENDLRLAQNKLEFLNQELEHMAWQDGLTGLANRRRFDVALNEEFHRSMRQQNPLGLILIDVDSFKEFNDRYGHLKGDECLKKIGQTVQSCVKRAGDLVARYGGEEIAILLPNADMAKAMMLAERVRVAVRDLGILHAESPSNTVTISCGVEVIVPRRSQHIPNDLVRGADKALYVAKAEGRDRVVASKGGQERADVDTAGVDGAG